MADLTLPPSSIRSNARANNHPHFKLIIESNTITPVNLKVIPKCQERLLASCPRSGQKSTKFHPKPTPHYSIMGHSNPRSTTAQPVDLDSVDQKTTGYRYPMKALLTPTTKQRPPYTPPKPFEDPPSPPMTIETTCLRHSRIEAPA
ncbi:hypothetical protein ACLB2K_056325 [Fragaria x ananassa]